MGLRLLALLALVACGDKQARRDDAAPPPPPPADAAPTPPPVDDDAMPPEPGRVTLEATWPTAPTSVRTPPGRTPCGTDRAPYATIHTLHGVAAIPVWLEGGGTDRIRTNTVIDVGRCTSLRAGAIVAVGEELRVRNSDERSVGIEIRWGEALERAPETVIARTALPVIGHTIAVPLERAGVYRIDAEGVADPIWVIAVEGAGALTGEMGAATIDGVAPGTYTARAWIPPAGGEPARLVEREVTVGDEGAKVTLTFGK